MVSLTDQFRATGHAIDSDRETLPFPEGGVFGAGANDTPRDATLDDIERTVDRMQSSLDELERELGAELGRELGDVIAHIGDDAEPGDGAWPPSAA